MSEIASKQKELKEQEEKQDAAKETLDQAKQDLQAKKQERDALKAELDKYDEKTLKENLDKARQAVDQANKDYEAKEQLKIDTLSKLETENKNVEAKKKELDDAKDAYQTVVNDVAAKPEAIDKAQDLVDQKQKAYEMASKNQSIVEDNLTTVNAWLAAAQKALDDANTNYQVASQKVDEFNTKQDELNNLKDEIEAQNSLVERYVQKEIDAKAVVEATEKKIVDLTKDKDNTEKQKENQKDVLAFMRRIREQGSDVDLSGIEDSELVLYLSQYAREVDELSQIESDLAAENVRYFNLL